MNPAEIPNQGTAGPQPPPHTVGSMEAFGPATAAEAISARALMVTPTYRSWQQYVATATRIDGTPFSEATRNQLRALGVAFIAHVGRLAKLTRGDPALLDAALRARFLTLSRPEVEAFLLEASSEKRGSTAQLNSVLRLLVRPWAMTEQICPPSGVLPEIEPAHPAEKLFETFARMGELADVLDKAALSPESKKNTIRIIRRFYRFLYERVSALRSPSSTEPVSSPKAEEIEADLAANFSTRVSEFTSRLDNDGKPTPRSTTTSERSALFRYFGRLYGSPPHSEEPQEPRQQSPKPNAARPNPEALTRLVEKKPKRSADSAPGEIPPPPPEAAPLPLPARDLAAEFVSARDAAILAVMKVFKCDRNIVLQLGTNCIRHTDSTVRTRIPSGSERVPDSWVTSDDRELGNAIRAYQQAVRENPKIKFRQKFFVELDGSAMPVASKPAVKGSRKQ